jgi:hypothetical protein
MVDRSSGQSRPAKACRFGIGLVVPHDSLPECQTAPKKRSRFVPVSSPDWGRREPGWNGPRKNGCDHANVCVWNVRYFYDVCDHVIMIILILSFLSTFRLLSRTPYSR